MIRKHLNNQRGFTLIQIFFGLFVIIAVGVTTSMYIADANKEKKASTVQSNISQLESIMKSYLFDNNTLPTKDAIKLGDFPQGTPHRKFFDKMVEKGPLDGTQVNDRFKLIDMKELVADNYLSKPVDEPDYYLADEITAKVFYVGNTKDDALESLTDDLLEGGGDVFDLKRVGEFKIESNGKVMSEVITSLKVNNKLIVGGRGTMTVAVLDVNDEDGLLFKNVKNLTDDLGGEFAVTELRNLGNNEILVHYHDGVKLAYKTISIK